MILICSLIFIISCSDNSLRYNSDPFENPNYWEIGCTEKMIAKYENEMGSLKKAKAKLNEVKEAFRRAAYDRSFLNNNFPEIDFIIYNIAFLNIEARERIKGNEKPGVYFSFNKPCCKNTYHYIADFWINNSKKNEVKNELNKRIIALEEAKIWMIKAMEIERSGSKKEQEIAYLISGIDSEIASIKTEKK